jgi:hypothetical protein
MVAFDYTEGDLAPSVIDTIVKVVLGLGSFATLVGIVIAINLIRGKKALGGM